MIRAKCVWGHKRVVIHSTVGRSVRVVGIGQDSRSSVDQRGRGVYMLSTEERPGRIHAAMYLFYVIEREGMRDKGLCECSQPGTGHCL